MLPANQSGFFHSNAQGSLDFAITLTCTYNQEGNQWVGVCDELGTSAFADTLNQARTDQPANASGLSL